jgi:trimeric autotransporter adhesin
MQKIACVCMLIAGLVCAAEAGDVAVRLDSTNGSSALVVYDAASNIVSSLASDGRSVGGGFANAATGSFATVSGGCWNGATGYGATVGGGGGFDNLNLHYVGNEARGVSSVVGGGFKNLAAGNGSVVGGGGGFDGFVTNYAGNAALGPFSVIAGGVGNVTATGAWYAAVGGGYYNGVTGSSAVVAGGFLNGASGLGAAVGGGVYNTAGGAYAVVPGGLDSHATGNNSFAAGRGAVAAHAGAFVWGDNNASYITSTSSNQFLARAAGGVAFMSDAAGTVGVRLAPGGNSWSALSDRAVKEHLTPVDPEAVLEKVAAMPVTAWNMKTQDPSIRHLGPMAQDFYDAFGLGETNTWISFSDASGVSLAAIQGLHRKLLAAQAENHALQAQVTALDARLRALEAQRQAPEAETSNP